MKWVTREKARVDRIACPWLINRFVDREPVFLFVPTSEVMTVAERESAIPYDVPGVELGHHGDRCSFDAFLEKYRLDDPALRALALIVRGADTTSATWCLKRAGSTPSPAASRPSAKTISRTWNGSSRRMTRSMPGAA